MTPFTTIFESAGIGVAGPASSLADFAATATSFPAGDTPYASGTDSTTSAKTRLEVGAGAWIECHEEGGVVEIHDPRLFREGREAFCRELAQAAIERCQAHRVEICLASSMCRLEFAPGAYDRAELSCRVAEAIKAATPAIRDGKAAPAPPQTLPAIWTTILALASDAWIALREMLEAHSERDGLDTLGTPENPFAETENRAGQLVDLALTGGSLAMAFAGAILPGIPSLPFFLLATRHAVRLTPQLDRFLRQRPWCAAILGRAEASAGLLRLDRRSLVEVLPIVAVTAAILMIVHPPLPVVLALEVAVMAFTYFREMAILDGRDLADAVPA